MDFLKLLLVTSCLKETLQDGAFHLSRNIQSLNILLFQLPIYRFFLMKFSSKIKGNCSTTGLMARKLEELGQDEAIVKINNLTLEIDYRRGDLNVKSVFCSCKVPQLNSSSVGIR